LASREAYEKQSDDFVQRARRFGNLHKSAEFRTRRCEPNADDEAVRVVVESRTAEVLGVNGLKNKIVNGNYLRFDVSKKLNSNRSESRDDEKPSVPIFAREV